MESMTVESCGPIGQEVDRCCNKEVAFAFTIPFMTLGHTIFQITCMSTQSQKPF